MIDWLHCHFAVHGNPTVPKTCHEFNSGPLAAAKFLEGGYSLHFYSQMLIIERARVVTPASLDRGGYSLPYSGPAGKWDGKFFNRPHDVVVDLE